MNSPGISAGRHSARPTLFLLLLASLCLWNCNVANQAKDNLLSLKVDDSLSTYDTLRVDILFTSGKVFKDSVFYGKYAPDADHRIKDLDLGENPPAKYQVLISGIRSGKVVLLYSVQVTPTGAEAPKILIRAVVPDSGVPADSVKAPAEIAPVKVVLITPTPLTLSVDGQAVAIVAEVQPKGADPTLLWSSSDSAVVAVDAAGNLHPGRAGTAEVLLRSRRDPAVKTLLRVDVIEKTQVKGLTVTPDTLTLYPGAAPFHLEANATPREAGVAVLFQSSDENIVSVDSQGNVRGLHPGHAQVQAYPAGYPSLALACRITVAADVRGPAVTLTYPASGVTTNAASIAVSWVVKPTAGAPVSNSNSNSENLAGRQGPITIVREAFDSPGNRGADSVVVFRDTIAPAAPAFTDATSPSTVNGAYASPVQWAWSQGSPNDHFLVSLKRRPMDLDRGREFRRHGRIPL